MRSIDSGTTASITFNALGQRVYRSNPSNSVSYWYDPAGQYLGGYLGSGLVERRHPLRRALAGGVRERDLGAGVFRPPQYTRLGAAMDGLGGEPCR